MCVLTPPGVGYTGQPSATASSYTKPGGSRPLGLVYHRRRGRRAGGVIQRIWVIRVYPVCVTYGTYLYVLQAVVLSTRESPGQNKKEKDWGLSVLTMTLTWKRDKTHYPCEEDRCVCAQVCIETSEFSVGL